MEPSLLITILTILTFLIGWFSVYISSLFAFFFNFILTALFPYMLPKFNHLTHKQLFKIIVTTYIFGALDSYFWTQLDYWDAFGVYVFMSTLRYYGQMQMVNNYHHSQLRWDSNYLMIVGYLIYHSKMYIFTNILMLLQHVVTRYLFQFHYKQHHMLMIPAFAISLISMLIRFLAFFTAKSNFTHQVASSKKENHKLVTNGIYSILRHPSYTGFFYFTIASMILIGNFFCAILFACMLSHFFQERIFFQEKSLIQFFGSDYKLYRTKTYVFIPYFPKPMKKYLPQIG